MISKRKYDGSYVCMEYIYEIGEFLDATSNYLFFEAEDKWQRLSPKEKKMKTNKKYVGEDEFVETPLYWRRNYVKEI